jgi:hypothetical protein
MPANVMTRCETKRLYKVNGVKESRWVEVAVADLAGEAEREIRCAHCHGAVKIFPGRADRGTESHVKHRAKVDTDNCQGGRGPQGASGTSSRPVV